MDISIVLPTYKEAENIALVLSEIRKSVREAGYEIIVVDDNSPDGTWFYAVNLIGDDDIVIRRINIKGLSTAILDGIIFSLKEYVVVMDADLQHPPQYINNMVKVVENGDVDVVIGSRYMSGGGVEGWTKSRIIISKGATLIAKLMLSSTRGLTDPMSGFFMVKREKVVANREKLNPRGYKILLEILEKCQPLNVSETPYVFRSRVYGKSKLGAKTIIDYILHVLKLSGWRPVKFGVVGALGTLVNLGVIEFLRRTYSYLVLRYFVVGSLLAIEISTLFNFTLHELWTFRDRRGGNMFIRLLLFHTTILPSILSQFIASNILFYAFSIDPLISQFIGILIGFPINYILSELGIWRKRSFE